MNILWIKIDVSSKLLRTS